MSLSQAGLKRIAADEGSVILIQPFDALLNVHVIFLWVVLENVIDADERLRPEATGAAMEETKWLKPSDPRAPPDERGGNRQTGHTG